MNFEELYSQAQNELSELSKEKAVLSSKIDSLIESLGLSKDSEVSLEEQVSTMKQSVESKIEELNKELNGVLSKLESIKSTSNESESFR